MDKFLVIDTETTWSDKVMSIEAVIADSYDMRPILHSFISAVVFFYDKAHKKEGQTAKTCYAFAFCADTLRLGIHKSLFYILALGISVYFRLSYHSLCDRAVLADESLAKRAAHREERIYGTSL